MSAIADEAGTAVQTIYDSVGPKRAIMLTLLDVTEEDAGVETFRQRLMQTSDPREIVALLVGLSRRFMEGSRDVFVAMMSAAPTELDVAAAWRTANGHHREGARQVAQLLASLDALRTGVSVERAGDVMGVLSWGTTWLQLIEDHGWSFDDCETWLTESLVTLLLRETIESRGAATSRP